MDVRGCADMCNADSSCKSFTYSKDGTTCQLSYSCTYEDSQKDESSDFDFYEKVQYDSSRVRQLQVVMFDAPFDCTEVVNFIQEKAELKKPFFAELDNIYSNDLGSIRYEPHQTDDGNCKVQIIVPPDPDEDRNSTEFACEFERTASKLLEENDTLEKLKQEHPKVYKWVKRITPSLAHGCDFENGDDVQSVCDNVNCDQFDAVEKDCRLNEYDVEEDEERGLDDPEIGKFYSPQQEMPVLYSIPICLALNAACSFGSVCLCCISKKKFDACKNVSAVTIEDTIKGYLHNSTAIPDISLIEQKVIDLAPKCPTDFIEDMLMVRNGNSIHLHFLLQFHY